VKIAMNYNDAKRYVRALTAAIRYVEERPFIIAIVELAVDNQRPMVAKGLSTCSPTDKWDSKRGRDVARGRAEAKLARRVMRQMAQKSEIVTISPMVISASSDVSSDVTISGESYYQV